MGSISITPEAIASMGVLLANAVFIIISVATYLRMNAHEQRRQQFIVRALNDTRDSGRDLKLVARDLARLMERAERSRTWQRSAGSQTAPGCDDLELELDQDLGAEPDMQALRPLESAAQMTPQAYAEWCRMHQVELDRVLLQRRRLQSQLATALQRQQESEKQAAAARQRSDQVQRDRALLQQAQAQLQEAGQRSEDNESALEKLRLQVQQLEARLERSTIEKDFVEDHLLVLDKRERQLRLSSHGEDLAVGV